MTYNQTMSNGNFTGGRLWLEDTDGNGDYHDTQEKILTFDAHLRHFAEDWKGERFTLTTYTPRGGEHLNQAQKDTLDFGFPDSPSSTWRKGAGQRDQDRLRPTRQN